MESYELIAVVVFFLIGYWVVDYFWPKRKSADAAAQAQAAASSASLPWHEVLGVRPDASEDEIREAYLKKSAEHHPDRVFEQGPEAREAATRMTRQLNDAFEQAMRKPRP